MMKKDQILFQETNDLLQDSIIIIESSQRTAYQTVDRILVIRNWLLGKRIAEEDLKESRNKRYGSKVIQNLLEQLTSRYGKGFDIGTSPSYVNKIVRNKEQIVNKTFLAMMENLGYDVQLTYVKRNSAE